MSKDKVYYSPRGIARYPRLNEPDTKFNKNGDYKTGLIVSEEPSLPPEVAEQFDEFVAKRIEEAKGATIAAMKKAKAEPYMPWEEEYDDRGETTGNYVMNFKRAAKVENKKDPKNPYTFKVSLQDSKGNRIPKSVIIYGGSEIIVAFEYTFWWNPATKQFGVSMRPKTVRVYSIGEYQGSDDFAGFEGEEEEGGFVFDGDATEGDDDFVADDSGDGEEAPDF